MDVLWLPIAGRDEGRWTRKTLRAWAPEIILEKLVDARSTMKSLLNSIFQNWNIA